MTAITLDRLMDRALPAAPHLLLAASAGVLGTAYVFQYGLDIQPCELCLYQRIPWWSLGGLACAVMMLRDRPGWMRVCLGLAAVLMTANAVLAGYHVGVEQGWWTGPVSCSAPTGGDVSFEELKAQILSGPVVRCDEVPWQLFGISMAGYNVLLSLAAAVFAAVAARHPLPRRVR